MLFQSGERNPKWKGGVRINSDGYMQYSAGPLRGKYVHRVLWEQAYGPIPEGMDVHHVDENRTHNVLENFELVKAEPHRRNALVKWNLKKKERTCQGSSGQPTLSVGNRIHSDR